MQFILPYSHNNRKAIAKALANDIPLGLRGRRVGTLAPVANLVVKLGRIAARKVVD